MHDKWMQQKKTISALVLIIVSLSILACLAGLLVRGGTGEYEFRSIRGEVVNIYGKGLYQYDSVDVVAQGKASDLVTLIFALPILLISWILSLRDSFRARLMLTGTLGYFLYTYMSYTFLWNYNVLFLVYVALMTTSLIALIKVLASYDIENMPSHFSEKMPIRLLAMYQLFVGFLIMMMWLGRIYPSVFGKEIPVGLEHYTTLVIQGMDLGFVVPAAFFSGILLLKRKGLGFLLTAILITKSISMLTSISAMIVNQMLMGVKVSVVETVLFPCFNLMSIGCLVVLIRCTRKNNNQE